MRIVTPNAVVLLLLSLIVLLKLPVSVAAGLSARDSYLVLSRDGTRMLVMIGPSTDPVWDHTPTATLPDGRVVDLRQTFKKSGAYDARTLTPLWQVDWYELDPRIQWSPDFEHVVRMNIAARTYQGWALSFYDRGKVVRQYSCDELLTGLRDKQFLPFSTWDWHWQWYEDFGLTVDSAEVVLSTARRCIHVHGERYDLGLQEFYTFELASGAMTSQRTTGRWVLGAYAAVPVAIVIVVAVALRAGVRFVRRRIPGSRTRRGFEVVCPS